jgi:hypothetical protein
MENVCILFVQLVKTYSEHENSYNQTQDCGGMELQVEANALILCVQYRAFEGKEEANYLAAAAPRAFDYTQTLPVAARVDLNSLYAGQLDFCDWANIAAHEIAHALGFVIEMFEYKQIVGRGKGRFFSRGINGASTLDEWQKEGFKNKPRYPILSNIDHSHWSHLCFRNEASRQFLVRETSYWYC